MKKIVYFIVFLIFSACTGTISESGSGRIVGIVADKTTGEPIATVNVILEDSGASTVTGGDGNFSFQNLQVGNYTLLLKKNGYKDVRHIVSVSGSEATESHLLIERIPGLLTLDREELDFGENYSNNTLSFSMVNNNYTPLSWEIIHNCRWIKEINPSQSITPLAFGKTQTVVVVIDRDLLLAGGNETVIVVRTPEGSSNLTVKAYGQERRLAALNILSATNLKATSAVLNGEITNPGYPEYAERGFVVSDAQLPTKETALFIIQAVVTTEQTFSARVSGLTLGKKYYARAYAMNSVGIAYSTNQDTFTTSAIPASLSISLLSEDSNTKSVVLQGIIIDEGDPAYTERGFVYSAIYNNPTIDDNKVTVSGSGIGVFEKRLTFTNVDEGLYIRAYAINSKGAAYSDVIRVFEPEWIKISSTLAVQPTDITSSQVSWSVANDMCNNSEFGGFSDWRLPNNAELSLIHVNKDVIGVHCKVQYSSDYWGSKIDAYKAHFFNFYNGKAGSIDVVAYPSTTKHVRCVRTLGN